MDKLGLILEGGGVKGAYQAGALSVLDKLGVQFDGVAGTSIGAINGAYYIQGGVALMRDIWLNIRLTSIADIGDEVADHFKNRDVDLDVLLEIGKSIFPVRQFLQESYDKTENFFKNSVDEATLRSSGKDLGFVTYNLTKRKPLEATMEEIEEGKLLDYLVASATYPVFAPKTIDGDKFTDGGVYNNVPINVLARRGYKKMLIIRTHNDDKLPKRVASLKGLDLYVLKPRDDLGHAMAFTSARAQSLYKLGIKDCKSALANGLSEFLNL